MPAVGTSGTVPVWKRNIRAAWVVGIENAVDDLKKIEQAAGTQGFVDRDLSVPFAKHFVPDMRMGRILGGT